MRRPLFLLAVAPLGNVLGAVLLEPTELPDIYLGAKARRRLRRYVGAQWPGEAMHYVFRTTRELPAIETAIDDDTRLVIQHLNNAAAAAA